MLRIGTETDGILTDRVAINDSRTTMIIAKVPSKPGQPERAILDSVLKLLKITGATASIFDAVKRFERK